MKLKSSVVIIEDGWNGKTITAECSDTDAFKVLLDENDSLKRTLNGLEQMFKERVEQHNRDTRNYTHTIEDLQSRLALMQKSHVGLNKHFDMAIAQRNKAMEQYQQLSTTLSKERAKAAAQKQTFEKQKAKKKRLFERIEKSRKKQLIRKLAKSRKHLNTALDVSYLFNHQLDSGEVDDGIIELVSYLNHYDPTNELREYVWSCHSVRKLLHDIRFGVVEDVFGHEWENRMLSGLVGLNVITIAELESWCMHPYRR